MPATLLRPRTQTAPSGDFDSAWQAALETTSGGSIVRATRDLEIGDILRENASDGIVDDRHTPEANPNWAVHTRGSGGDRPPPLHNVDPNTGLIPAPSPDLKNHPDLHGPNTSPPGLSAGEQAFGSGMMARGQTPPAFHQNATPPEMRPAGESPVNFNDGSFDWSRVQFHQPIGEEPSLRLVRGAPQPAPEMGTAPQAAAPAQPQVFQPPVATSPAQQSPFTPLPPQQLPAQLQPLYEQMQGDYQRQVQALNAQKDAVARAQQYSTVLQTIEADPNFRQHLVSYFQQPPATPQAPQAPQLDTSQWDEDTKAVVGQLNGYWQKQLELQQQQLEARWGASIRPVQEMKDRMDALVEMQTFQQRYPRWSEFVQPTALAEAKRIRPDLPVEFLYRSMAYPAIENMVLRAQQGPSQPNVAGPQIPQSSQAAQASGSMVDLNDLMGRRPPPSTPKTRQEVDFAPKDFTGAWDKTLRDMGLM